jgi:hypothetical protein
MKVPRSASNRNLALFLGVVVLAPVMLVAGPFRGRFFPSGAREVARLAVVPPSPFGSAELSALIPADLRAELGEPFVRAAEAADWAAVVLALERVPAARATPPVRYLHGLALLFADRPAPALAGLADAITLAPGTALADDARFARAQALLRLAQSDAARAELSLLAAGASRHAEPARRQLAALAASDRR